MQTWQQDKLWAVVGNDDTYRKQTLTSRPLRDNRRAELPLSYTQGVHKRHAERPNTDTSEPVALSKQTKGQAGTSPPTDRDARKEAQQKMIQTGMTLLESLFEKRQ